jgi:hypothetical protein
MITRLIRDDQTMWTLAFGLSEALVDPGRNYEMVSRKKQN